MNNQRTETELRRDFYIALAALEQGHTSAESRAIVNVALAALSELAERIGERAGQAVDLEEEFEFLDRALYLEAGRSLCGKLN
jgi:DNA-binding IclR family transcriptional regulator